MQHPDTETLSSYIDGELPEDDAAQVEAHLTTCDQCQQEHAELLAVSTLVRGLPAYQPRKSARIEPNVSVNRPGGVTDLSRYLRPLAVAAIVILVAVAGLRIVGELTESEPNGESASQLAEDQDDGTESELPTSQSVTDAPGAAVKLPRAAAPPAGQQEQQAAFEAEPTTAVATVTPTAAAGDADDASGWSVSGAVRTVVYVALGTALVVAAIWMVYQRTRRVRK